MKLTKDDVEVVHNNEPEGLFDELNFEAVRLDRLREVVKKIKNRPALIVESDSSGMTEDIDIIPGDRLVPVRFIDELFGEVLE